MKDEILIYSLPDKETHIEIKFDGDTVWLNQEQLAILFERDQSVISRHIRNVFKEGELQLESNMQKMHIPNSDKPTTLYNLDVIISVGYRVKSLRGTQFRQWATKRLKDFLIEGVAINEKRLAQKNQELRVLHDGIRIVSRAIEAQTSIEDYIWLKDFSVGLQLLDDYDHESLDRIGLNKQPALYPNMDEYQVVIEQMRNAFNSDLFGKEKDGGFQSATQQIRQGFGDKDIYPSIEEKAAMLLYMIIKNHAFVDGNKRIAAASFLLFLDRNGLLYATNKQTIISPEALAGLTLLVAASKAEEMETVRKLLVSVLNRSLR